jgi:excisionase family DNA binding protein
MPIIVNSRIESAPLPPGELMTAEEMAGYLRVSIATIRRWTNSGKLACYRIGGNRERRFSQGQLQAFLARNEQPLEQV